MSEQLQQEEWEVLQAIYADYVSRDLSDGFLTLEVPIELPEPKNVTGGDEDTFVPGSLNHSSRNSATSMLLSSLPPIILDIRLPPSYPLTTPPEVVSIHAIHSWLPSTSKLQQLLSDMWSPAEGVLCAWVEFICSGEFLESLEYTSSLRLERCIRIPHPDLILLMPSLVAYDTSFQQSRFSQTSCSCQICLTSIKGAKCILLSCSHVFCRPCMEDFWGLLIKEGNVGKMGCPDPACVKDGREATEDELKRVVSEREVQRWKWLREKQASERDPTMVYCPVAVCQTPVLRSTTVEPGSSWGRFRECPNCRFAFCAFCNKACHGLSECQISQFDMFIEEYESLPEDSSERKAIEDRYGKKMFELLVSRSKARYDAEQAAKTFLERYATPCPGCQTYIEKNRGCNHMQCTLCYQHFCFLCGDKLSEPNVYKHFSIKTIPCYNRLWDQGKFS